ncbi:sensor histidine kinase [Demequina aestuarii]|uniref:sensor histidine kinase n=1 Tax=Demequina aestuarii TaxID=327095 RepID=UPI00078395D1|nr:sensor histidine kinase [Demequina aestuarii]
MAFIRRYFAVTWSARTWREIAYLLVGLPVSIVWFTYILTMYAVSIALVIVWVGVVIAAVAQWTLRPIGDIERATANVLVAAGIEQPPPRRYRLHSPGQPLTLAGAGRWGHALLHDVEAWRTLAWLMMRIVLGPVGFALALCAIVVPVALVGAWLIAAGHALGVIPGPGADEPTAQSVVDTVSCWVLVGTPVVAIGVPMFAWVSHHYSSLVAGLARWALGPCGDARVAQATERAELAETQVRVDQELHDSIGHMITMNIVQAGAGAHVFDADPEFARQALRNIEERGRVAMGELDRIIAAMRGDDAESRTPLPTLDDVPGLVDQARSAGLEVETRFEAGPAPAALSRAAYAIVREGVTNAAKHAPGSTIHVHVAQLTDALAVSVRNGPAAPGAAPIAALRQTRTARGHGIAGIRDRAALLGGTSLIGDRRDGGYEVMVLLPLELSLSSEADDADAACCRWSRVRARVVA